MNNYFQLSKSDQQRILQQASAKYGLPTQAIEKDMWVSTILQIVFTLPFSDKIIFKGGTSLSKVWRLINRFSEDIDLALDRSLFGLDGDLTKKTDKETTQNLFSVCTRNLSAYTTTISQAIWYRPSMCS